MDHKIWTNLFDLISTDNQNEDLISAILARMPDDQRRRIINKTSKRYSGAESMLMWAAWRHKVQTVQDLLTYGADPFFANDAGENVVTYLQIDDPADQAKVFEIAKILHEKGVRLDRGSMMSWSLTKKIQEHNLEELRVKLHDLGYYIPKPQ